MNSTVDPTPPSEQHQHQIVRGRETFSQRSWLESYNFVLAADRERSLEAQDIARLAIAADVTPET
jgi:hypothetical protein